MGLFLPITVLANQLIYKVVYENTYLSGKFVRQSKTSQTKISVINKQTNKQTNKSAIGCKEFTYEYSLLLQSCKIHEHSGHTSFLKLQAGSNTVHLHRSRRTWNQKSCSCREHILLKIVSQMFLAATEKIS